MNRAQNSRIKACIYKELLNIWKKVGLVFATLVSHCINQT